MIPIAPMCEHASLPEHGDPSTLIMDTRAISMPTPIWVTGRRDISC